MFFPFDGSNFLHQPVFLPSPPTLHHPNLTLVVVSLQTAGARLNILHQLTELQTLLRGVFLGRHAVVAEGGVAAELHSTRGARAARLGVLGLRVVTATGGQRDACRVQVEVIGMKNGGMTVSSYECWYLDIIRAKGKNLISLSFLCA